MTKEEWKDAKKEIDPNYKGSIFELLEFQPELCPVCRAHLKDDICLNACHLGTDGKERFNQFMAVKL